MGVSGIYDTIPDKICLVGEQNVAVTWGLIKTIAGFQLAAHIFTFNTLRTGSFKLFKRPFPGFLTILTL